METKIEKTQDGWSTLYVPDLKEHYHSVNGAKNEAEWVYIDRGFIYGWSSIGGSYISPDRPLRILEMGFGTGLNAILSYQAHQHVGCPIPIIYTTVEAYPLSIEKIKELDYTSHFQETQDKEVYNAMHTLAWEAQGAEEPLWHRFPPFFRFRKIQAPFQELSFAPCSQDVIYYDAFSPKVQPELWQAEIFKKLYEVLTPGGALITYCAQGEFKKNLNEAGFQVESLQGPEGKREITRGVKPSAF